MLGGGFWGKIRALFCTENLPLLQRHLRVRIRHPVLWWPAFLVSLFRKQELPCEAYSPVRCPIGGYYIVISFQTRVDCLITNLENSAYTTTNRHCPNILAVRLPVGGKYQIGDQKPSVVQIIINKRLAQRLIDVASIRITGKGPKLTAEYTHAAPTGYGKRNPGKSRAPLTATQLIVSRCSQGD